MNAKQKGKRGELELANTLKKYGFEECRRGQQYSGIGGKDVVGLDHIHIECKRVEKLNIYNAMEQAERDCQGDIPCVFHRKNNVNWLVTMPLDEWIEMYKCWIKENPTRVIKGDINDN
jgi:Holliday junction resolvase